ncbi:ParB/RepB/Spo0J family partition protein [Notoacmeibacter sp. MSK16QG-6]|uniref:ParB/RepB/Spo0J family partition protein n=1 Tax=Notoacmeibacter sp. MSK16QG-6 TaxID=2957982 RepID=UPI00209D3E80|nr:ParB/RepB/Spo0J family partition protein [Notoacmeibacter sp. MSK16QG-6]MCP1201073.1 ParB N-terminal domain-containing protein [Notoacmeibacter sp. MSK16QG-6]
MKTTVIRKIALHLLDLSPKNVRKTPPTQAEEDALEASIAAHGLGQNLSVEEGQDGRFLVHAGGRRLKALQRLWSKDVIDGDYKVACKICDPDEAAEQSLAENFARAQMHPADEYEAFADLIENGAVEQDVADRFGVSVLHVRKRMKLARVAPELLDYYRAGSLTLDALMAFTLTDSHDRQREIWSNVEPQYRHYRDAMPSAIRRLLTETSVSSGSVLGRFVGIDAYEDAGGHVTRDLFSDRDNAHLDDRALVEKLALEKLDAAAEPYRKDWRWVEVMLDMPWDAARAYARVYPEPLDFDPSELQDELATIDERLAEIDEEDDVSDEEQAEYDRLNARYDEIETQLAEQQYVYSAEAKAIAGCFISLSSNGELRVEAGLVKPEDVPAEPDGAEDEDTQADDAGTDPAIRISPPSSQRITDGKVDHPRTVALKEAGLTAALADDLRAIRHQIMQVHLAVDFEVAFDVMLYSMCRQTLSSGYVSTPIDVSLRPAMVTASREHLKDSVADRMMTKLKANLRLEWMELPKPEDFVALSALSPEEKQELFAHVTTAGLVQQLSVDHGADPVVEEAGRRLGVDVAASWRPTAEAVFKRVTKDYMLRVARERIGDKWTNDHAGYKKGELADAMEAAFSTDARTRAGLTPATAAKTGTWVPEGMSFAAEPDRSEIADSDGDDEAPESEAGEIQGGNEDADGAEDEELPEFLTSAA